MKSQYSRFQRRKSPLRSPRQNPRERRRDSVAAASQLAAHATDLLLFGVLLAAPLVMGGRSELGRFAYVVSVGLLAISWSISRSLDTPVAWRSSGISWLLLAGVGLICLQLAPLPQPLLRAISPWTVELLPLWCGNVEAEFPAVGTLQQLSLTPHETYGGLFVYGAHVVLFLVLVQRLQAIGDVEKISALPRRGHGSHGFPRPHAVPQRHGKIHVDLSASITRRVPVGLWSILEWEPFFPFSRIGDRSIDLVLPIIRADDHSWSDR